ncbi:hypothetical protein [Elizabethkingia anophelis]|nr:hypothetical protein [Elizabethkingia anophelis]MCW2464634.1 hypothetical protein [Elizabethkingia anophelis]MCW2468317.1 hypothetical protein [Elizabethkingia anophelis]MCW2472001.1 hypothetical protein [Elizabethkingia anophelis]
MKGITIVDCIGDNTPENILQQNLDVILDKVPLGCMFMAPS